MIDIVGLDTKALEDGYLKGSFYLSGIGDDTDLNEMLLSFTSYSTKNKLDVNASLSIQNTLLPKTRQNLTFRTKNLSRMSTIFQKKRIFRNIRLSWIWIPS